MTYSEIHAADLKERQEQRLMEVQRMHIARVLKAEKTKKYYTDKGIKKMKRAVMERPAQFEL